MSRSLPLIQSILAASAPLVAAVVGRISELSRFTGEETPAVVHWIDGDESVAIDDSERAAIVNVGVVTSDGSVADATLALCKSAIVASVGTAHEGVTAIQIVELEGGVEARIDDGNGNEVEIPLRNQSFQIFYRIAG